MKQWLSMPSFLRPLGSSVLMSNTSSLKSIILWWLSQNKVPQRRHTSQHKEQVFRPMSLLRSETKSRWVVKQWDDVKNEKRWQFPFEKVLFHCQKQRRIINMGRRHKKTVFGILKKQTQILPKHGHAQCCWEERRTETQQNYQGWGGVRKEFSQLQVRSWGWY